MQIESCALGYDVKGSIHSAHHSDNYIDGDPEGRDLKMMLRYLRIDCRVSGRERLVELETSFRSWYFLLKRGFVAALLMRFLIDSIDP